MVWAVQAHYLHGAMKTWECFQSNRPVGRVRIKLAEFIANALPGVLVEPHDLQQNNPQFSRAEVDGCNWDAWGSKDGQKVHFHSWCSMTECGRVTVREVAPYDYNVDPFEEPIRLDESK